MTDADLEAMRKLNAKKDQLIMSGLDPKQAERMMSAEETVFSTKDTNRTKRGTKVSDNFKKISEMDPSNGIVIHNPVTGSNEAVLGKDNQILNLDGSLHPATKRYLQRNS